MGFDDDMHTIDQIKQRYYKLYFSKGEGRKTMYQPTVNDRVQWREHEGWVYTITEEYFTLEAATKLKEDNSATYTQETSCSHTSLQQ